MKLGENSKVLIRIPGTYKKHLCHTGSPFIHVIYTCKAYLRCKSK